jgi:hypothetical protein
MTLSENEEAVTGFMPHGLHPARGASASSTPARHRTALSQRLPSHLLAGKIARIKSKQRVPVVHMHTVKDCVTTGAQGQVCASRQTV